MKIQFVLQIISDKEMVELILAGFRGALTRSIVNYINKNIKNTGQKYNW